MKLALRDRVQKSTHFIVLAGDLKFHAPIDQITDPAGNVETFGYVAHRPTKPYTLNIAFVKDLERDHDDTTPLGHLYE